MFRLILLIFIFLYFSGNFFYGIIINYIPFKNAQNINLYNTYKIFEQDSFSGFISDENMTGTTYNIGFGNILVNKTTIESYQGLLLILPYKSGHRHGEQIEIFVPIINDLGNTSLNDDAYKLINLKYKNNLIKDGEHHLLYGIDYSKINSIDEISNNTLIQDNHNIFMNKFYLIKKGPTNYILR